MRFVEFECAPSLAAVLDHIDAGQGRFLLEDARRRTAVIGAYPKFVLSAKRLLECGVTRRLEPSGDPASSEYKCDPFETLRRALDKFRQEIDLADVPFAGGAVGYFSYDLGRSIERVPSLAIEDVPTPDYHLGFYDSALCVDLTRRRCVAVSWSGDREALEYWRGLAMSVPEERGAAEYDLVHCPGSPDEVSSNFTKEDYLRAVERIKDYIAAGDVYQVNLSQRFEAALNRSPWELHKALRRIGPAPNSCYIELGEPVLACASPEVFLTYDPLTRLARTKPIKGTRPRGRNAAQDAELARELAGSEKDRAENLMIVDMERNDLGRVAKYGSVRVPSLWDIEPHPNVFQMVSTVEAELAEGYGPVDLLKSCFPGGSITGAPKIRAMEIIEELEPHRRGIYTGSAGFIDFRGKMDLNIVIRSFVISGSKAYFHAGGGIVTDSDPEMEYQETLDKISSLRAALRECEVSV
ncbi:MAG: aminodeoxychorismate synthase component I [Armatimonadetes bacterium]|nr:aminodeoxychorismate synthase component I [Armatimonadota bacterium]